MDRKLKKEAEKSDSQLMPHNSADFPGKIQNRFLDSSILLRETGSSITARKLTVYIAIILIAFIGWANILDIDEVAVATGEIIHQGDAVKVQHLVGGRVKKIFIKNGSFVKEGDTLLRLDPIVSKLERESSQVRKQLLDATKIRLEALINNTKPDFGRGTNDHLERTQMQLYESIQQSLGSERNILANKINQVETEIQIQRNMQAKLRASVKLIKEELDIALKLKAKGHSARAAILAIEKEYTEASYNLKQVPVEIKKQGERLEELHYTLASITDKAMETFSRELSEVDSEIAMIERKISIYDSNIDTFDIKAPVEGYVHDIHLQSPGEVAIPEDILLTLIPTDKPLIARVKISTRDIGHIKIGQPATLRIATYDSRRHGVLHGKVLELSPTALIPKEKREPYYEGIIELDKAYVGNVPGQMKLFSGMTLTADIKTGSKSLFEYLLKPIYLAAQSSFKER